ncbi:MAG: hypothetical protein SCH71_16580 [Desulfobulbaceae bacterium]|nr:hypothetical protein [Desulfobulbaceae bacterium]
MTLCAAWIRQLNNLEELVFATDSALTGGERWDNGIKLFELTRKDCLLCFTGSTGRAYPLILNLVSAIRFNSRLESPATTIAEILNYVSELFTSLIKTIISEVHGEDIHTLRAEARFLFGGWCWQTNRFRIWKLYYSKEAEGFLFDELTSDDNKTRFYTFMGEAKERDIEKEAKDNFHQYLLDEDRLDSKLDMEPLKILRTMAQDMAIREVGGSLQIAKVYRSGRSEFFGIFWPSSNGKPCFQGREYNNFTRPPVRYYNPDTLEVFELELPENLNDISDEMFGVDAGFLQDCYPEGRLKEPLSDSERHKVKTLLADYAYSKYLKDLQEQSLAGVDE